MSEHRIISHVQLRAELQREGQFGFLLGLVTGLVIAALVALF